MKIKVRIERWMKKYNLEFRNLYSSPYFIWITKSMRIRWAGHLARMREEKLARSYAYYGEE
jgi:hypothetical protein